MNLEIFKDKIDTSQLVCIIKVGSHLYGTNSESSDVDYKGVYVPTLSDYLLQRVKKSISFNTSNEQRKNSKDDIDIELYSINHFIKLACEGQTNPIDMLFANKDNIILSSIIWEEIVDLRVKFLQKDLDAFVGYARNQANKYIVKSGRYDDAKKVFKYLQTRLVYPKFKIKDFWGDLPTGKYISKEENKINGIREYIVCNRKIQETVTIDYAVNTVEHILKDYGDRTKKAALGNVDWKSLSHAIRVSVELVELYQTKKIVFPLKESNLLKSIKEGEYQYDEVITIFNLLMEKLDNLKEKSNFPKKIDKTFWDDFIKRIILFKNNKEN